MTANAVHSFLKKSHILPFITLDVVVWFHNLNVLMLFKIIYTLWCSLVPCCYLFHSVDNPCDASHQNIISYPMRASASRRVLLMHLYLHTIVFVSQLISFLCLGNTYPCPFPSHRDPFSYTSVLMVSRQSIIGGNNDVYQKWPLRRFVTLKKVYL